jgi:hypothetical protein
MSPHRIITASALAVLGALGPAPLPAVAASSTVTVPARGVNGAMIGPPVTAAVRSFPAGTRFVVAKVSGRHGPKSTRRPTMLSVELMCGSEGVQATTNVVTTVTLMPRRVVNDATDCRVVATSAVNQATAGDGVRINTQLTSESVTWGAVGHEPDGWPDMVPTGQRFDAIPLTVTVPAGVSKLKVTGDMKVTTCTSVGGSRENGSPYLCNPGRLNRKGSEVSVSLVAEQLRADGSICALRTLSSRRTHITPKAHHAVISQNTSYVMSLTNGCSGELRIMQRARVISGADIVVHRRGTITNLYR